MAVLSATVTVSSAELKALHSTPRTLVAAPGAGKAIMPLWAVSQYDFLTAAYALSGDENYGEIRFAGVGAAADGNNIDYASSSLNWLDGGTESVTMSLSFFTFGNNINGLDCENAAVILTQDAASAYITGGGSVTLTIWYVLVDL